MGPIVRADAIAALVQAGDASGSLAVETSHERLQGLLKVKEMVGLPGCWWRSPRGGMPRREVATRSSCQGPPPVPRPPPPPGCSASNNNGMVFKRTE